MYLDPIQCNNSYFEPQIKVLKCEKKLPFSPQIWLCIMSGNAWPQARTRAMHYENVDCRWLHVIAKNGVSIEFPTLSTHPEYFRHVIRYTLYNPNRRVTALRRNATFLSDDLSLFEGFHCPFLIDLWRHVALTSILRYSATTSTLQHFRKTLSVRRLKKIWVAGPQQPWSIASGVYNRDGGRYWSCTLVHPPVICRYGRPRLMHNYSK